MKQIKLCKIICLLAAVIGGSCNNFKKNGSEKVLHRDNPAAMKGTLPVDSNGSLQNTVIMIAKPSNIKLSLVDKVKLTVKNNTSESLSMGQQFSIEFYNGKNWEKLPATDHILFEDIAYEISPGDTEELTINLKLKPFKYKSGRYRICKHVTLIPSNRELDLTAELRMK